MTVAPTPNDASEAEAALALGVHSTIGAEGATLGPEPASTDLQVEAGTHFGRYVVLERLGAGGMGVVYAAWDPQLDRKLALKLLDPRPSHSNTRGQARLLREAQAMARLVHPNVVTIHDVGTVEGRVFIAMEFVEGRTLREWLAAEDHTPARILDVFEAAGRGLEAAHAANLVHRDFKPDNVMLGADSRVRVLDFGLARRGDDLDEREAASSNPGEPTLDDDSLGSLTQTGVMVGTPAYMSPEQFRCAPLDARSDQFSFCVALWEALAGERPFAARRQVELVVAVSEGKRQAFPASARVPARVVEALERGLAPDPGDRWPDMSSLLDALTPPEPGHGRRWWLPTALGLALAAGAGATVLLDEPEPDAPIACEVPVERLDGIWDSARADALARSFAATEVPWAETTAARVQVLLDDWTAQWRTMVEDTCVAHHHRHELSAELFDLRMACLDQRLGALDSLVELLTPETLEPAQVDLAISAVANLEGVKACSDPQGLRAKAPPEDPQLAAEVAELTLALDRREQMQMLGLYEDALAEDDRLRPAIEALDYLPLTTRYHRLHALDQLYSGDLEGALESATMAMAQGRRTGDPEATLNALLVIARVTLFNGKPDESERWLSLGDAIAEDIDNPWFRYELFKGRGFLAGHQNQARAAFESFEQALTLARESFGPESFQVATELSNYGKAASWMAREDPSYAAIALDSQRKSLALLAKVMPGEHRTYFSVRVNLLEALVRKGETREALAEADEIIPLLDETYGRDRELPRKAALYRVRALEDLERCPEVFAHFDDYLAWLGEHRLDNTDEQIAARAATASVCASGHPRAAALLDEALALARPEGALPSTGAGLFALTIQMLAALDHGEIERAAELLELAGPLVERPELAQGWGSARNVEVGVELLALARDPDDADARARLAALDARLDPLLDRDLSDLSARVLARAEAKRAQTSAKVPANAGGR